MPVQQKTGRIAKNTFLLYLRMMIVMFINLFAVRVVLNALGEEDYGIYNVIAGVITMLSGVTTVLASATQRFYSYSMGDKQAGGLREIFSSSVNIYLFFSIGVLVLGETIGLWFVNAKLVIPEERLLAANLIYQFSILSFICSMMQSPFFSAVIAHEDMGIFAFASLVECLLKFGSAWLLTVIVFDRLEAYGFLILLVHVISLLFYIFVGRHRYEECHYQRVKDKHLYKDILSYSGWNLFGSLAAVGMNQVNTILVNVFFGPIANAARAIALQINGALSSFSGSFIMAIRPPMIKAYAEKDYTYLNKLFTLGNKFLFYCLVFIALPLLFEMDTILTLWLKTASDQTVLFSQLIVVYALILSLNNPISIIMQAMGRVKEYYVPVESVTLLCPVITWVLYKMGLPAESTFWAMIGTVSVSHLIRIWCLNNYYDGFSVKTYLFSFILPACFVTALTSCVLFFAKSNMDSGILRLILLLVLSFVVVFVFAVVVGLNKEEKYYLKVLLRRKQS